MHRFGSRFVPWASDPGSVFPDVFSDHRPFSFVEEVAEDS